MSSTRLREQNITEAMEQLNPGMSVYFGAMSMATYWVFCFK
jgi:hypothetical protein